MDSAILNISLQLNNKRSSSSNVNEVFKNSIFLKGPKKLIFVRMYRSAIIGVVGPQYPCCSLVVFCAFVVLLVILVLLVCAKSFRKTKINK